MTPLCVSYGLGVDSTAVLCLYHKRGIRPDLIIFADVGDEKPETYAYLPIMQEWLKKVDFPEVTVVRYQPKNFKNYPPYKSLSENCLTNGTLPGISFGPASCSMKWKKGAIDPFVKAWQPAKDTWAAGERVRKMIGYDASPRDRQRFAHAKGIEDPKYEYVYPLIDEGLNREGCKALIQEVIGVVPPKSACYFCLSSKPHEIRELQAPLLRRIVVMEARAKPRLRTTEGLWRSTVKGCRGATARPGNMTEFIVKEGLLSEAEVKRIQDATPKEIALRLDAAACGEMVPDWHEFLERLTVEDMEQ